ncbi:hypothetical protein ACIBSW_16780 [Actinoplanes sp. NPDC049668]|uniref:hypothetical protein n=1 Tax=unclassified Actinoplanes TaxID=2626549 RepID=UPI0033AFFF0A
MYWAERRIIDTVLYRTSYSGELPILAGADDLLAHLRTQGMIIACGLDSLSLEPIELQKQVTPPQPSLDGMTLVGVNVSEPNTRDKHTVIASKELTCMP